MVDLFILSPMAKQQRILEAVRNYGKRLFSFIRSRVKSDEDAEDILQDVWYQLSSLVDIEPIEQLGLSMGIEIRICYAQPKVQ